MAQLRNTRNATPVGTSSHRRTIASYTDYRDAERAVDWLSDQGFAVERGAIIGTGLRSVEQVTGRMTVGRGALAGAGEGALIGALIALLFGLFFSGPDFGELLLYSLVVGASFGAITGAIIQAIAGDGRNFASTMSVATDHYEVQVDEDVAADAKRILAAMPAGGGSSA
jgi:Heat induced stress protein YflT domain